MTNLKITARQTGGWYLGLAVTGMLGFLVFRGQIVADDGATTVANITDNESFANLLVVTELAIVATQAMLALWFFRLFRGVDSWLAGSLAALGFVNAITILASAGFLATAVETATAEGSAETVQTLTSLADNAWGVGSLFFGLWLIPMGLLVARSGWMPKPIAWFLIAGGIGYIASAVVAHLLPDYASEAELLSLPANVGEFWIVGYLLIFGVRKGATAVEAGPVKAAA